MSASNVSIVNLALTKLGAQRIASLEDDSKNAREAKAVFELTRDAELRRNLWNFAIERAELAALTAAPIFGFAAAYPLPTDCLRVVFVGDSFPVSIAEYHTGDEAAYRVEGRKILTDLGAPLALVYVKRVTDPTQFDTAFVEVLATKLAHTLALSITDSSGKRADLAAEYREAIGEARRLDAIENPPEPWAESSWNLARI